MKAVFLIVRVKVRTMVRGVQAKRSGLLGLLGLLVVLATICGIGFLGYDGGRTLIAKRLTIQEWEKVTAAASLLLLPLVGSLVVMDFYFAHTLNVGQRTRDIEFLRTLPITFEQFYFAKLAERALTDWQSHLFFLPSFLGIGLGLLGPWVGLPLAFVLYGEFQLAFSSILLSLNFYLARFLTRSALQSLVNWINLLMIVSVFGVPSLAYVARDFLAPMMKSILTGLWLELFPGRWLVGTLLLAAVKPHKAAAYFMAFSVLTLLIALAGRWVALGFQRIGWTNVDDIAAARPFLGWRRNLSGYAWKDSLMIRRDQNLMVNGIFLPVVICGSGAFFGSQFGLTTEAALLVVTGALIYFHAFGAINAVGAEGVAIGLLATIPMRPERFLTLKAVTWGTLGTFIMLPFYLICLRLFTGTVTADVVARGVVLVVLFAFMLAFLGVALSVHFANYRAKMLQQASTLTGKLIYACLAGNLVMALLADSRFVAFRTVLLLELFIAAIFAKAAMTLRFPHESERIPSPGRPLADAMLFVVIMGIAADLLNTILARAAFNGLGDPRAFLLAFVLALVGTAAATVRYFRNFSAEGIGALGFSLRVQPILFGLVGGLGLGFLARGYLAAFFPHEALAPETGLTGAWLAGGLVSVCVVIPIGEELLFRGFVYRALTMVVTRGWAAIGASAALFALFHPPVAIPPVFALGCLGAYLYGRTRSLPAAITLHMVYNVVVSFDAIVRVFQ